MTLARVVPLSLSLSLSPPPPPPPPRRPPRPSQNFYPSLRCKGFISEVSKVVTDTKHAKYAHVEFVVSQTMAPSEDSAESKLRALHGLLTLPMDSGGGGGPDLTTFPLAEDDDFADFD